MNQLSIKSLLVCVCVVALTCTMFFAINSPIYTMIAYIISSLVLLSLFFGLLAFDDGICRAFSIGALPPLIAQTIWFFLMTGGYYTGVKPFTSKTILGAWGVLIVVCGFVTASVFLLCKRSDDATQQNRILGELVAGILLGLIFSIAIAFVADIIDIDPNR